MILIFIIICIYIDNFLFVYSSYKIAYMMTFNNVYEKLIF